MQRIRFGYGLAPPGSVRRAGGTDRSFNSSMAPMLGRGSAEAGRFPAVSAGLLIIHAALYCFHVSTTTTEPAGTGFRAIDAPPPPRWEHTEVVTPLVHHLGSARRPNRLPM